MHKYDGRDIRDIVNRKDWQDLRASLVGTWKSQLLNNVKKLRMFLGNINTTELDKLIIVYNYLTGSAFRSKIIHHPEIDKLREEVKNELISRKKK